MLQTLVLGLGRAGAALHLPVLARIGETGLPGVFADHPILAYDPRPVELPHLSRVRVAASLGEAMGRVDPGSAVAHLCTPPGSRLNLLEELARNGFRRFIVEKPLGTGRRELDRIGVLRRRFGLRIAVVAPWLSASLTERLVKLARSGEFGSLRSLTVNQHKPRFHRSLTNPGHSNACEVELPHAVPVALRLAGPAELVEAEWSDMACDGREIPRLGGASLTLRHDGGVLSRLRSDLTSPIRERSISLSFDHGIVTGHYPLSCEDDHAQLEVVSPHRIEREVFRDDALTAFFLRTYRAFRDGLPTGIEVHERAARLLIEAKERCARGLVAPHAP
ncbi:hypothetical protein [Amycolatopsis albispora]|uniref:Gfo/Idh/MocA-like oxidoreductase N-terminal domain-containing protein n=1 Tax=Amycolatopsis albispora TaxID=1804986 RepID=A0A344LIY2_9PSEU|nr:hypothetical protein [Amycolatopsis albispora]AXB48006.1 hypothetical protein A4R43_40795 [Amycolatopsis albispora]